MRQFDLWMVWNWLVKPVLLAGGMAMALKVVEILGAGNVAPV
jgi:hypothetical protein